MPIQLRCKCGNFLYVAETLAGKTTMCSGCGGFLDVPEGKQPPPVPQPTAVDRERKREEAAKEVQDLKRRVRDAFDGDIEPVRRTAGYRFAAGVAAVAMVSLPLAYIGLILGGFLLLGLHAYFGLGLFGSFDIVGATIVYVLPLILGPIFLLFMAKPLLARPSRTRRGRVVRLDKEPALAAFIVGVARAVHAPTPQRVEVNCLVNASAGFGSGLTGMFGRDLTLTIGLPLVAGMSANQLAGVLAHEFGHFTQGAGMRVSFVVRTVNHWFARVVYERDEWDEWLLDWSREWGWLGIAGMMVRVGVMLGRAVLWVFMMVGHTISCFLLRKMEYDADRSEARLAGVRTFGKTSRRIAVLEKAADEATEIVAGCWLKDRYPDDFAGLVVGLAENMNDKERRELMRELESARTGPFDSHPCYCDRLESVEREEDRPVFELDLPAVELFKDFQKLAETSSMDHYKAMFGPGIRATLRPTEDYLKGRA